MENKKPQITIREAISPKETEVFWQQLYAYLKRDIFRSPENEDMEHFLGEEYRSRIQEVHKRQEDRCHYLFFCRERKEIGFAMPVIFNTEDGKCFIMEFCVYPEFRGGGTGRQCAGVLLDWAKEKGALYAELNCGGDERRPRFWKSVGFIPNGIDQWGEPLMIYPPEENVPYAVEVLTDATDWQLLKLKNGLLAESGQEAMNEAMQQQFQKSVREGNQTFFFAKRGYRAVGMCSVEEKSPYASIENFYVEPAFRQKGIEDLLIAKACTWCHGHGVVLLSQKRFPQEKEESPQC